MKWSRFRKIWSGSWTEKWRSTKKGKPVIGMMWIWMSLNTRRSLCMRTRLSMMRNRSTGTKRNMTGSRNMRTKRNMKRSRNMTTRGSMTGNRNMRMSGKMMSRITTRSCMMRKRSLCMKRNGTAGGVRGVAGMMSLSVQ